MLDLYGTNHDARRFHAPDRFDPERQISWTTQGFDFIPQGGGEAELTHRCPGEAFTVELTKQAIRLLTQGMSYEVPEQDLTLDLSRIPARAKSGFVMRDVRPISHASKPIMRTRLLPDQRISAAIREQRQLPGWQETAMAAVMSGTVTSIVTTAALALLARSEGRSAFQPTNATSHWLHGENAGRVRIADARHTLLGYCTHHLSAIFWALPFEAWLAAGHSKAPTTVLRKAALTAALAALVDYRLVPKRLTPGWETVLSKRSVGATFAAMALGLALGGMASRKWHRPPQGANSTSRHLTRRHQPE